jgi:hypothetical protein
MAAEPRMISMIDFMWKPIFFFPLSVCAHIPLFCFAGSEWHQYMEGCGKKRKNISTHSIYFWYEQLMIRKEKFHGVRREKEIFM